METLAYIVPGQIAYLSIPASTLRNFSDGMFPHFAKFPTADIVTGAGHRYKAGHDLLLDIPNTFLKEGFLDAYKHFGHVVLTDFPTKAGIPIPGLSQSGLGGWLESVNIGRGWLNVNICDAGMGIIAVAEGHSDLISALDGSMKMDAYTFFDTFVEGGIEVVVSIQLSNPIILGGCKDLSVKVRTRQRLATLAADGA